MGERFVVGGAGVRDWAPAGAEVAAFEAEFVDPVGRLVRQRWVDAVLAVAFEGLGPVSAFGGAGEAVGAGVVVVVDDGAACVLGVERDA